MNKYLLRPLLLVTAVLLSLPVRAGLDNADSVAEEGVMKSTSQPQTQQPQFDINPASIGELASQNAAGLAHLNGIGVKKNEKLAFRWFWRAADQGYAEAQANLGDMYLYGKGINPNYVEALKWYNKAAAKNNAKAQYALYFMYINGFGVRRDKQQAIEWLKRSAEGGYPAAQTKLGLMYRAGINLPRVPEQAAQWLRRAAEQGDAEAQYHLARQYAMGIGVERDFVQSYVWYELADDSCPIDSNPSQCAEFRESVARVLTPGQLSKAEQLAKQMRQKLANSFPDEAVFAGQAGLEKH
ncbi:tetratricopeptide repeat protein [Kaarinaea lacus]